MLDEDLQNLTSEQQQQLLARAHSTAFARSSQSAFTQRAPFARVARGEVTGTTLAGVISAQHKRGPARWTWLPRARGVA